MITVAMASTDAGFKIVATPSSSVKPTLPICNTDATMANRSSCSV